MPERSPTPDVRKPTWQPSTFRAMRHRNYRLYFFGQVVSLIGSWMQTTAVTWLAYEASGKKATWAALISVAAVLPTLLLAVIGGGMADRWPRRPLIFLAQSAMLALSLILAVLIAWEAPPTALLVVLFLTGVVMAIDTPARLAFVIEMVGRDDLPNAVALNSMIFNTARMIGPALAGLLLPMIGAVGCVLINAATFVAVLGALLAMRLPPLPPVEHEQGGSLLDGFLHLARRRGLLLMTVMAVSLAFFGWPLLALLTAFASEILGPAREERGFSWMTSAVGAGALVGALVVASFSTRSRRLLLALGVALTATAMAGLALTRSLPLALAWCAASGAGLILFFAAGQAAMQLGAGEHNRGRVMGVWLMVLAGAQPAGNLVFGYLTDALDVRSVLLLDAAGIAVTAAVVSALAIWSRSAG